MKQLLLAFAILLMAGCGDTPTAPPPAFLIDCQVDSPLGARLGSEQFDRIEQELCAPLIRALLESNVLDAVSWRIWESHFHIMVQAGPGSDATDVSTALHSVLNESPLRREHPYSRESLRIGPSPVVVQLARRPAVDSDSLDGPTRLVVQLARERTLAFDVTIEDVREQVAASLGDSSGALDVSWQPDSEDLMNLRIATTASGMAVPLSAVATVRQVRETRVRNWMTVEEFRTAFPTQ